MDQEDHTNKIKNYCCIRKAKKNDMETVQKLIQELADFENMSDGPKLTAEDLIRDSGLNNNNNNDVDDDDDDGRNRNKNENVTSELFHCYVAEIHDENYDTLLTNTKMGPLTQKKIIVGYAICFFSYSTWEGKTYFLEDLYVQQNYRKKGIGRLLFEHIIQKAKEYNCPKIDFHVLNWNPAKEFYIKMGAKNLTENENWQLFRLRI